MAEARFGMIKTFQTMPDFRREGKKNFTAASAVVFLFTR
jgi:hypothetical protein